MSDHAPGPTEMVSMTSLGTDNPPRTACFPWWLPLLHGYSTVRTRATRGTTSLRRLDVAALSDLIFQLAAPPREGESKRYGQAGDAADHQDHAHRLNVHVLGRPGDREPENRSDDDECDAAADGHGTSSRVMPLPGNRVPAPIGQRTSSRHEHCGRPFSHPQIPAPNGAG